jgi:hydroxymethylbilane synthase
MRIDDLKAQYAVSAADDSAAAASLQAERSIVTALGGGCQLPLGAIAVHERHGLTVHAMVATPDGSRVVRRTLSGSVDNPTALGARVADELASAGAIAILDALRATNP